MGKIYFFTEETSFQLKNKNKVKEWINLICKEYDYSIKELNFIFCSDPYLHQINVDYLDHDTFTDIITFDNSEEEGKIEGDIFISIDRIKENAASFNQEFNQELHRVIIHGVLHLIGFGDKTEKEAQNMRIKENEAISKLTF